MFNQIEHNVLADISTSQAWGLAGTQNTTKNTTAMRPQAGLFLCFIS